MAIKRQFYIALLLLLFYIVVATLTYRIIGDPGTTFADALYMAVLTLTTIGYTDTGFASTQFQKKVFTGIMVLSFCTQVVFAASVLNAFIATKIHMKISEAVMKFKFKFKRKHIIIFGVGKVAPYMIPEFFKTKTPLIVVSKDEDKALELSNKYKGLNIFYWPEKHFTDELFNDVNLKNARIAILDLGTDEKNHITADLIKEQNKDIEILAVGDDITYAPIMTQRGNKVVNPHFMCAMRIASLAKRPSVVNFLDRMLYKKEGAFRIEEVTFQKNSEFIGKTLEEINLPATLRLLPIGIMEEGKEINILPLPEDRIRDSMTLIVQGEANDVEKLRDIADGFKTLNEVMEGEK